MTRLSKMHRPVSSRRRIALAVSLLALVTACRRPAPSDPGTRLGDPPPDSVERVLFLIGDAGEALPGESPLMARLQQEIEAWSVRLARDSAVSVVFLGDNVYPEGIRDPAHPEYALDTLRLRSQLDVVAGPEARRFQAGAFFLPGNHDWGNLIGASGLERLTNMQVHIDSARATGLSVRLVPVAGQPGPEVVDLGQHVRMLFLDTHWWLQAPRAGTREDVIAGVEEAIRTAGTRHVVLAAHHPYNSGGSHGGPMPIWEGLGVLWLLRQTGSLVQDLNATVYRELLDGLHEVFQRVGPPLIFAGGHDHSLQVLEDVNPDEPHWSLVSGAGSKSSEVTFVDGMVFADDLGGFMRVSFLNNGGVLLHVVGAENRFLHCAQPAPDARATCMEEGRAAFEVVFSERLR